MEAHMDTCRLRVKIGPYEMEAEGPRDFVEKHYGSFSERIPQQGTQLATVPIAANPVATPGAEVLTESTLAPIFHQESNGRMLILTAKPSGDSSEVDAVLLLLLGHKEIRGVDLVSSDELLYGLKQSGYPVERADRIAARAREQGFLIPTGVRRGTRYRLTVPGTTRAKRVAQELLEQVT
jgi:hypothetical protein